MSLKVNNKDTSFGALSASLTEVMHAKGWEQMMRQLC